MKFQWVRDCLLRAVIAVLLSVGVALFATAAFAANVDYEGESLGAVPPNTPLAFDHPLYVTALAESDVTDGVACAPNCPDNGTKYHLNHGSGFAGTLTITGEPIPVSCDPDCSPFDLFKIDVAEPHPGSGPVTMIFFGTTSGGESLEFNFVTDGIVDGVGGEADFETVVFPDTFRDLASVAVIDAAPYLGVAIDNIIVEPEIQPAPALAPWGLGALALVLCTSATLFRHTRATAH
jgi:hypothetical protein